MQMSHRQWNVIFLWPTSFKLIDVAFLKWKQNTSRSPLSFVAISITFSLCFTLYVCLYLARWLICNCIMEEHVAMLAYVGFVPWSKGWLLLDSFSFCLFISSHLQTRTLLGTCEDLNRLLSIKRTSGAKYSLVKRVQFYVQAVTKDIHTWLLLGLRIR